MSKQKPTKKVASRVKLEIQAGQANPSPPTGTALGPRGVNIMEFCKAFNDKTKEMRGIIPVKIDIYGDKSFTFKTGRPKASYIIKEALKLKKGSKEPGKDFVSRISKKQLMELAEQKQADLTAVSAEAAYKTLKGTAVSMGIEVIE